jgi:putative copper resistance protein D
VGDPLFYVRALHFAATITVAGVVIFIVCVSEPAFRSAKDDARGAFAVRIRLAWMAWIGLFITLLSGVFWLVLTAESMSGQPLLSLASQGVLGTVLTQTEFGNDWLVRFVAACLLGGLFVHFLSAKGVTSLWLKTAAVLLAAVLVGTLAFAGHAIGGQGIEGIVHPSADILHLIAAAAWVGALMPLAVLLTMTGPDTAGLAVARTATRRFSTLGIVSVATLLLTGIVNSWYLVGSVSALTGTGYGQLLLVKLALFAGMVGIAAVNWSRLTPRLVQNADAADALRARRLLRRNAVIEAAAGAAIIGIVAVLGILPPASHLHQHGTPGAIPADASFQHIHTEDGMADVTVEPGHVGTAGVTIHLWDADENQLSAQQVTLTLAPPAAGGQPIMRPAVQDADGLWHVDGIALSQAGNWTVTINAVLGPGRRLTLAAPIVIDAK